MDPHDEDGPVFNTSSMNKMAAKFQEVAMSMSKQRIVLPPSGEYVLVTLSDQFSLEDIQTMAIALVVCEEHHHPFQYYQNDSGIRMEKDAWECLGNRNLGVKAV